MYGELILCTINRALRLPVEAQADLLRYAFRSQAEPDFYRERAGEILADPSECQLLDNALQTLQRLEEIGARK